jgi:hypothetical protein
MHVHVRLWQQSLNPVQVGTSPGQMSWGPGSCCICTAQGHSWELICYKILFSSHAFQVEKASATDTSLQPLMHPVILIEDTSSVLASATANLPAPLCNFALPPVIITEKGESLDEFIARSAPDFFTALQVMVHIARKLEQLHAAGWVHRDLKPGNAIWLPSQNSWTLIDFGCAARTGVPPRE